ncbi:hypothetical protein [Rhodoferax sp. GW822-FHT02A01]|uniref:hypothetical protein n=1 Tax=Rhodoferax sp. GW822-FHT02A01 TaxID=3141537 RepID=UPI00315DAECC
MNCLIIGPTFASSAGEYAVQKSGGLFQITPTGKNVTADDVTPQVDMDVITDVVRASARVSLA